MIPSAVLRHRVDVEPLEGTSGEGVEVFGTKRQNVPAWVNGERRAVRTADGTDVIAAATCLLRPTPVVAVGSRITHRTATYVVVGSTPSEDATGPHSQVLLLDGPR